MTKLYSLLLSLLLVLCAATAASAASTSGYVCYTTFQNYHGNVDATSVGVSLYSEPYCKGSYRRFVWVAKKYFGVDERHSMSQLLDRAAADGRRVTLSHTDAGDAYYVYVYGY